MSPKNTFILVCPSPSLPPLPRCSVEWKIKPTVITSQWKCPPENEVTWYGIFKIIKHLYFLLVQPRFNSFNYANNIGKSETESCLYLQITLFNIYKDKEGDLSVLKTVKNLRFRLLIILLTDSRKLLLCAWNISFFANHHFLYKESRLRL